MKLYSFDMFDTLVVRSCGLPDRVFYLMAQNFWPDEPDLRSNFVRWRKASEAEAVRRLGGWQKVRFEDIYQSSIPFERELPSVSTLMELEKNLEYNVIKPVAAMVRIIRQIQNAGHQVCIISDMYHSLNFLKGILVENEVIAPEIQVFVSCEYGELKGNARLYNVVRDALNPDSWIHFGDNPLGDIKQAKLAGIEARLVEHPYSNVEQKLNERSRETDNVVPSILAGIMRAARLQVDNAPSDAEQLGIAEALLNRKMQVCNTPYATLCGNFAAEILW
jgi:predicted HAD superfamily hydrolase